MSRSGYIDDCDDNWELIRWRGAVASAICGRRGQLFLREMLVALDALPEKRLIAGALHDGLDVCALGAVAVARGLDVHTVDPDDYSSIAGMFGIAEALTREIEYINDEWAVYDETPEQRYVRMRAWVVAQIRSRHINASIQG